MVRVDGEAIKHRVYARCSDGGFLRIAIVVFMLQFLGACVSTEALYAEYDAADCLLVAETSESGELGLHDQLSDTRYPWEPAVYFEFDSHLLTTAEIERLEKSMQVVKQFPSLSLGLQGFTDKFGSKSYNRDLAQQRVDEVREYLTSNGIASARIHLQPIGEVLPQIGPDSNEARATNRRVELMLLQSDGRPLPIEYAMSNN